VSAGNGSFCWFHMQWPPPEVAVYDGPNVPTFEPASAGFHHQPAAPDREFFYRSYAPWQDANGPTRAMTAFLAGHDETTSLTPDSAVHLSNERSLVAAATALQQQARPLPLPPLGIVPFMGVPSALLGWDADALLHAIQSFTRRVVLEPQDDHELFETYYEALVGLEAAADRSSWATQLDITKGASALVGLDVTPSLTPTSQDLTTYGLDWIAASGADAVQKPALDRFGRAMIVVARALKLGLTNTGLVGVTTLPTSNHSFVHAANTWNSESTRAAGLATAQGMGKILDGFYADLATVDDPHRPGVTLDQRVVLTAHGDTPHSPLIQSGWPSGTPSDSNWLYVLGQGRLRTGWFGRIGAGSNHAVPVWGFNPTTGDEVLGQPAVATSTAASAAALYAIVGDSYLVRRYYRDDPIDALIV